MKAAIMQPTYLPWAGYFSLIDSVELFVFLDDVQIERQSWQTRNRVCIGGREQMLTVPVKKTGLLTQIRDARVNDAANWRKKHQKSLHQAYGGAPFGEMILQQLDFILCDYSQVRLADINIAIITAMSGATGP